MVLPRCPEEYFHQSGPFVFYDDSRVVPSRCRVPSYDGGFPFGQTSGFRAGSLTSAFPRACAYHPFFVAFGCLALYV